MSARFAGGEEQWRARLGTLRQVVRQEVVTRQLAECLAGLPPRRVLDVGCGQGTQALLLARRGHAVTGLDASAQLLGDFRTALTAESAEVGDRVRLVRGEAEALSSLFAGSSFDVVLCHGVLMYFPDPGPLLDAMAQVLVPGGIMSLLVRNGDALAMRPGLLGDWDQACQAFDEAGYQNRIGLDARADRRQDLTDALAQRQLSVTPVVRSPDLHRHGRRRCAAARAGDAGCHPAVRGTGRPDRSVPARRRAAAPDRPARQRSHVRLKDGTGSRTRPRAPAGHEPEASPATSARGIPRHAGLRGDVPPGRAGTTLRSYPRFTALSFRWTVGTRRHHQGAHHSAELGTYRK
jgi:S-adenosylmethionine-dependent methyltransferase